MLEISEMLVLRDQIDQELKGKVIREGLLGNSPHKFVWYNRTEAEFKALTAGKTIGAAEVKGRWLFVDLEPGYRLVFGEMGGAILYHPKGSKLPAKYHLLLHFEDGSALSVMIRMWGAIELYLQGEEQARQYIRDMAVTPTDKGFTREYFGKLVETVNAAGTRSVKSILTQEQTIPGLGNSSALEIMYLSGLNPRKSMRDLSSDEITRLFEAILNVVNEIYSSGGRSDETNLYGMPGRYIRKMDAKTAGTPCARCGTTIEKSQYLGGACYYCPQCQR